MWFDAISTALLHSTWQFTLIALWLYLARQIIPDRASQIRYLSGCAALIACLGAFLTTGILTIEPSSSVTLINNNLASARLSSAPDISVLVVIAWFMGTIAMLTRNSMSLMRVSQLKADIYEEPTPYIHNAFHELCRQIGVPSSVTLKFSDSVKMPCTFGTLKPIVLLPFQLVTQLSGEEVEAVLAHEIAHIRRYDYLVNIFQQLILSVLYYHPAVHFISRAINHDREIACDDLVSKVTGSPQILASALGKATLFAAPRLTMSALGRQNHIASRMERLLTPTRVKSGNFRKIVTTALATMGVLLFANLMLAHADSSDTDLTKGQMADLRDEICHQVKLDGYYQQSEFSKDSMVRVGLHKDSITLNGQDVTIDQLPRYLKIVNKYGLKQGEGQYIFFSSTGSEIELGRDSDQELISSHS